MERPLLFFSICSAVLVSRKGAAILGEKIMSKLNLSKRLACAITLTTFTIATLVPPEAQAAFYRPEMQDLAKRYAIASKATQGGGMEAFSDEFRDDLHVEELIFIESALSSLSVLPKVKVHNAEFRISFLNQKPIILKPINLDEGLFRINGLEFTWDERLSFEENMERLAPLTQAQGYTFKQIFWNLLVPSAHASGDMGFDTADSIAPVSPSEPAAKKGLSRGAKIGIAIAAVVVVALVAFLLIKRNKDKKKKQEQAQETARKAAEKQKERAQKDKTNEDYAIWKDKVRSKSDQNYQACQASWVHHKDVFSSSDSKEARVEKLKAAYASQQNACSSSESSGSSH
jgi:hypothetical protein